MIKSILNKFKNKPEGFIGQLLTGANADPSAMQINLSNQATVLQSALAQGVAFPHNCRAGGCGSCKCRLVKGQVKELTDKSFLLSAEEIEQNVILACQSIPKSDLTLEVKLAIGTAPLQTLPTTIIGLDQRTEDIIHLQLQSEKPVSYRAGQYAEFALPAALLQSDTVSRSYSFASPAAIDPHPTLDFYIRHVPGGLLTDWLFQQAKVGERLTLRAPLGDFYCRPGDAPLLFIAGGSGLAPILAILGDLQQQGAMHRNVTLMFGARTQKDLYAESEIQQLQQAWQADFNYIPVLSQEPEGSTWQGRRGWLHEQIEAALESITSIPTAYLCGPPPMIDASEAVLRAAKVNDLYADRFFDQSHEQALMSA